MPTPRDVQMAARWYNQQVSADRRFGEFGMDMLGLK